MARAGVPRHHPIFLHSFSGSLESYKFWVGRFSNTVFGVSKVTTQTQQCREFGRIADLYRMALESDTPYMSGTSPFQLLPMATWVADLRKVPIRIVLLVTGDNVSRLFQY